MHIVHADFGVDFRCLEVMQVCTVLEWLHNNIACNFNITFLPNIWIQTWNLIILLAEFGADQFLVVVGSILGVCQPNFGAIQVCIIIKWMCNNILNISNIEPSPNFWNHAELRSILCKIKTCTHADWLSMMFRLIFEHQNLRPDRYACI